MTGRVPRFVLVRHAGTDDSRLNDRRGHSERIVLTAIGFVAPFLSLRETFRAFFGITRPPRPRNEPLSTGTDVAAQHGVPIPVVIGRSLACCLHPWAAWRRLPASGRAWLVAAYVSASYVTVLAVLLIA